LQAGLLTILTSFGDEYNVERVKLDPKEEAWGTPAGTSTVRSTQSRLNT
jgi:hypothetical protein